MNRWAAAMAFAVELTLRGIALAADPRFPDWPCNQVKVPEISVAAVWAGPPIDDVGNAWEEDAAMKDLVARLAARRTPLEDAQKTISDVMTGTESERQKKAKLIFAGLFKTLNHERSEVMQGIERYFRKQREFSDQIRSAERWHDALLRRVDVLAPIHHDVSEVGIVLRLQVIAERRGVT